MTQKEWKIIDDCTISCFKGNEELNISARNVIEAEKSDKINDRPSTIFPYISFSTIPLNAKLIIEVIKDQIDIAISGYIALTNQINSVQIKVDSINNDQIIHDNIWYPILAEDIDDIRTILTKCEINSLKDILLKSYLYLLRNEGFERIIEFKEVSGKTKPPVLQEEFKLKGLNANLYNYQITGFKWLTRISAENFGCILADEMGLGKTLQIIALILSDLRNNKNSSLIIAPSSLLENWKREFYKFSPKLSVRIHSGGNRTGFPHILEMYNVIITTYDIAIKDLSLFEAINWNFLICDEAQAVKNPFAKRTQYIKKITRRVSIAVTGTPFENKLLDIWSIVDLVATGLLGKIESFNNEFPNNVQSAERLEPLITPIILRRMVAEVAQDLPKKIIIPQPILMDDKFANYYDDFRKEIIRTYDKNSALVSLQLLRMFCCDPSLVLKDGINYDEMNIKFQRLIEIIFEIYKSGGKALIFTSFQEAADKINKTIYNEFKCFCQIIDGRVKVEERQTIIDDFSSVSGSAFLVLNPKAAGTGLNITAANHVIHYNLEWNPSVEDQANARAYRRGQKKPVFIYKFFYIDSVEEFIEKKGRLKRKISEKSIIGIDGEGYNLVDIYAALQLTPILK